MRCIVDRNEANAKQKKYKSLDRLIKDAYGLNPSQMKLRMEWAQQEARSAHPLNGRPIKDPPEDGFQKLMAKMEARGITPRMMADFDGASQRWMGDEESWEGKLPHELDRREDRGEWRERVVEVWASVKMVLQRPVKRAGVFATCFLLVLAIILIPKIDTKAKRRFFYESSVRDGNTGRITWNNQNDHITEVGSLEKAYAKIKEVSGTAVLKLNYIPEGMRLSDYNIERENIRLEFSYKNNQVFIFEFLCSMDNTHTRASDCQEYTTVFNEWINQEIKIQRNVLSDNKVEYMAHFECDNAYYYICGIMPEKDFIRVMENLVLEK